MLARRLIAAVAPVVATLAAPGVAAAHLHNGTLAVDDIAHVTTPAQRMPFHVGLYRSDRALHLTVLAGHRVTVLGYLGESLLRIGPLGVDVDAGSPTAAVSWLLRSGTPTHGWLQVSRTESVVWHDPRLRPLPPGTRSARWSVRLLVDGRPVSVGGVIRRVPPPALWPWLLLVAALAAAAVLLGRGRVERACAALGVGSVVAATIAIVGLGFSVYASGGVRLEGADAIAVALAGIVALVWAPARFRVVAGAGLAVLGLALGLSFGSVFLHAVVLAVLPGGVVRAAVAVAVGSGLGGSLLGLAQWRRVESALAS